MLYVGKHDPEETHVRGTAKCCANTRFWQPLVDGDTFPDLKNLEVRHIWAIPPPMTASLDLTNFIHSGMYRNPLPEVIRQSEGLSKLERICLESPPELDSTIFMQLVGNPKVATNNLTNLDLRFCFLNNDTVAELLYHAPPALKRLALIHGMPDNRDLFNMSQREPTHLCPLIREYSKRLERLDYGSNRVCQQIFFEETEIRALESSGAIHYGDLGNEEDLAAEVDAYAMKQVIQSIRQRSKQTTREKRIREALDEARKTISVPRFSDDSAMSAPAAARIRHECEMTFDEEEEQRRRQIGRSNQPWSRRIISFGSSCHFGEAWAGTQVAAELDEDGVEWVLASQETSAPTADRDTH